MGIERDQRVLHVWQQQHPTDRAEHEYYFSDIILFQSYLRVHLRDILDKHDLDADQLNVMLAKPADPNHFEQVYFKVVCTNRKTQEERSLATGLPTLIEEGGREDYMIDTIRRKIEQALTQPMFHESVRKVMNTKMARVIKSKVNPPEDWPTKSILDALRITMSDGTKRFPSQVRMISSDSFDDASLPEVYETMHLGTTERDDEKYLQVRVTYLLEQIKDQPDERIFICVMKKPNYLKTSMPLEERRVLIWLGREKTPKSPE